MLQLQNQLTDQSKKFKELERQLKELEKEKNTESESEEEYSEDQTYEAKRKVIESQLAEKMLKFQEAEERSKTARELADLASEDAVKKASKKRCMVM